MAICTLTKKASINVSVLYYCSINVAGEQTVEKPDWLVQQQLLQQVYMNKNPPNLIIPFVLFTCKKDMVTITK